MNTEQIDETPPHTAEEGGRFGGGDELVECELEVAQALTCLAHNNSNNNTVSTSNEVNVESIPVSSASSEQQETNIQIEQELELKASSQHTLNYPPSSSRKSRQSLTEEEKEERRLCRVLANRESARQTIRRRQAMYDELTRKAADLAAENENLKKKKELVAKEYNSLKNKNTSLREQIAKLERAEAEESDGYAKSTPVEISTTNTASTSTSTSHFNQSSVAPFFWPSIVQPFILHYGSQNVSGITSMLPSPASADLNSINVVEGSRGTSNPGNPLFVLPLPCLIPFHPQSGPFSPWPSNLSDRRGETSSVHQCSTSYVNMENNQEAAAVEAETGVPDSVGVTQRDFLREVGTSGLIDSSQQDNMPGVKAVSSTGENLTDASEKPTEECITCSSKKSEDAIAAAEARRRRKELLKLKSQHYDRFGRHQ